MPAAVCPPWAGLSPAERTCPSCHSLAVAPDPPSLMISDSAPRRTSSPQAALRGHGAVKGEGTPGGGAYFSSSWSLSYSQKWGRGDCGMQGAVHTAWPLPRMKGPEEHGVVRPHEPLLTLTPTGTRALTSTHSLKEPGMF